MGKNQNERSLLRLRYLPTTATVVLLLGCLLIFNLSGFYWMRTFTKSKEKDLQSILEMTGRSISNTLSTPRLPLILTFLQKTDNTVSELERFGELPTYNTLREKLEWQCSNFRLNNITLLTTGGLTVADASRRSMPGAMDPFAALDSEAMLAAQQGNTGLIKYYQIKDEWYRRLYLPLKDDDDVVGILQLSIRIPYIPEFRAIRTQALTQSLLGSLFLLVIGITLLRLLRRTVRAEESLMQTTRAEAMGAMTAGIAHEIRNPLAAIHALAEEAADERCPPEQCKQNILDILDESDRLAKSTSKFLALTKKPDLTSSALINVQEELETVVRLMQKSLHGEIGVIVDFPKTPCYIRGNEKALHQICLNLMLNAAQALPKEEGMIKVEVRGDNETISIAIRDNGHGIPRKVLERIFEPFFTTKKNGSGLGLPVTKALLESMDATITITSKENRGTLVTMVFPTAKQ